MPTIFKVAVFTLTAFKPNGLEVPPAKLSVIGIGIEFPLTPHCVCTRYVKEI